jgi:hypothetical protein
MGVCLDLSAMKPVYDRRSSGCNETSASCIRGSLQWDCDSGIATKPLTSEYKADILVAISSSS